MWLNIAIAFWSQIWSRGTVTTKITFSKKITVTITLAFSKKITAITITIKINLEKITSVSITNSITITFKENSFWR